MLVGQQSKAAWLLLGGSPWHGRRPVPGGGAWTWHGNAGCAAADAGRRPSLKSHGDHHALSAQDTGPTLGVDRRHVSSRTSRRTAHLAEDTDIRPAQKPAKTFTGFTHTLPCVESTVIWRC